MLLRTKKGGKVIDSGGFGCIFYPAIKCKNKTIKMNKINKMINKIRKKKNLSRDEINNKNKYISKLMKKNIGEHEYNEMLKFSKQLKKIPNANKYFLINNIDLCEPDKLSLTDLQGYEKYCSNTIDNNITSNNINYFTDKLISLNMPYGGKNLRNHLEERFANLYLNHPKTNNDFIIINNSLIGLLKNGIIPMNKKQILHLDIKPDNILYNTTTFSSKLIDWGLSIMIDSKIFTRDSLLMKQSILYNRPISCILFLDNINEIIGDYCETYNYNINDILGKQSLIYLARYILKRYLDIHKPVHLFTSMNIIKKILQDNTFEFDKKIEKNYINTRCNLPILHLFINYIAEILDKYLEKKNKNNICHFNLEKYFNEVYKHNVDIYGFLTTYLEILIIYYNKKVVHNNLNISLLIIKLKDIIFNYCFLTTYATTPIPVNTLIKELKSLNTIILKQWNRQSVTPLNRQFSKRSSKRSSYTRSSSTQYRISNTRSSK